MPSLITTHAQLAITGAEAATVPARFTGVSAKLRITAASATIGPGTGTSLSATVPELDRLTISDRIPGESEMSFMRRRAIWQTTMEKIEEAFEALTTQVSDNTTLINRIANAESLAEAANDNAVSANNTISITNSYTSPTSVLTASSDGTVTIAAHTRFYGDGTSVSVDAGSTTGSAQGDYATVYYADAARTGGTVSYQVTTNAVSQTGNVHIVGQVTIPTAGEPTVSGTSPSAPGYIPPGTGFKEYETF